jgi:hypothetical protein
MIAAGFNRRSRFATAGTAAQDEDWFDLTSILYYNSQQPHVKKRRLKIDAELT